MLLYVCMDPDPDASHIWKGKEKYLSQSYDQIAYSNMKFKKEKWQHENTINNLD